MTVGERIRALREDRDIPRKQLAADLHVSCCLITLIEQGRRNINADMLIRFAEYFGVSADYLLGLSRKPLRLRDIVKNFKDAENGILLSAQSEIKKLNLDSIGIFNACEGAEYAISAAEEYLIDIAHGDGE